MVLTWKMETFFLCYVSREIGWMVAQGQAERAARESSQPLRVRRPDNRMHGELAILLSYDTNTTVTTTNIHNPKNT